LDQFDGDRTLVLQRASQAAVTRLVVPGIDLASSRQAVQLAEDTAGLFAAVGVHPNSADAWDEGSAAELRQLANSPRVVAIGEIGLDYYRQDCPVEVQREVLEKQLELAAELELPVILHNRQSLQDLLPLLEGWSRDLPASLKGRAGVLHAYAGDLEQAQRASAAGFYLGIGGPITFKNAEARRQVTRQLPLARALVETDAPFLAPQAHRGQRNEPAYTRLIAEKLAELLGVELGAVAEATTNNATTLFGWSNGTSDSNIL
jgi:TatD DNase family protein